MTDKDPLAGIAVFVAAGRAGSFTVAGQRLGLTKSAVGKAIARLETRLGVRLFHRTTRLTRLTADGEAYLATCAAAIDEIAAAQAALSSEGQVLRGRLRIDMPISFGRRVLLPLLAEIVRPHPDLNLSLTFTDTTSDLILEDIDLAIRFGALKDSSHLIARHLLDSGRAIVASPAYLAQHGRPQSLADLQHHHGIVGMGNGPPLDWLVLDGEEIRRIVPPAMHRASDGEAIVDMAVAGLGMCQMPTFMVRDAIEDGRLEAVLPDLSNVPVEVHLVWPQRQHLSPQVRHVVDMLAAYAAAGQLG
jgi:DNA-binding transcriptional LysR family regulator